MLERPDREIPDKGLELFLCGHRVEARITWKNKLYLGLMFEEPITALVENDILEGTGVEDELGLIWKKAPPCFCPNCHVDCSLHTPTAISEINR